MGPRARDGISEHLLARDELVSARGAGDSEDGTCTDRSRCIPEGARLQLDPWINCSTWQLLTYEWQRQMCRTLQVYGGIIIDTNDAGPTIANQWHGSLIGYTWPWLRDGQLNLPRKVLSAFSRARMAVGADMPATAAKTLVAASSAGQGSPR